MKHLQEAIRLDSNEKVKDVSREERADPSGAAALKKENERLKIELELQASTGDES